MFKKVIATLALAVMAIFAVPAAATAYGPNSNGTVVGPIVPGQSVTIVFGPNAFSGSSNVSFTVNGNSVVVLGAFKAATTSFEKTAEADGSIDLIVTLPEDASGTYSITGTDTDGNVGTASITVPAADAGSNGGLPNTGAEVPVLALWTAGGALALGAALIAVMTIVRRQRLSQD